MTPKDQQQPTVNENKPGPQAPTASPTEPVAGKTVQPQPAAGATDPAVTTEDPEKKADPAGEAEAVKKAEEIHREWQTKLVECCRSGNAETLREVLLEREQAGGDIDEKLSELGEQSPLMFVCQQGEHPELATQLLAAGSDPLAENEQERLKPLLLAASSKGSQSPGMIGAVIDSIPDVEEREELLVSALKRADYAGPANLAAVLEPISEEQRLDYLSKAGLNRSNYTGPQFEAIFSDAIPEQARQVHADFIHCCTKGNYKTLGESFHELKKQWPEFSLIDEYEGQSVPLHTVCAAEGVNPADQVQTINRLKAMMADELGVESYQAYKGYTFNDYERGFAQRSADDRRLLAMALQGPVAQEQKDKIDSDSSRYQGIEVPRKKRSADLYKKRLWRSKEYPSDRDLNNWDRREFRGSPAGTESGVLDERLYRHQSEVRAKQKQDERANLQRDLAFLSERSHTPSIKPMTASVGLWGKLKSASSSAPLGIAGLKGSAALKGVDKVYIDEAFKVDNRQFQITALLDPQGDKGQDVSNYVASHLQERLKNRLEHGLQNPVKDIGIRDALKLAMVDLDRDLAKYPEADTSGLDATVMLSYKNPETGKTELWTATLGEAATVLMHADGRAEQLSRDSTADRKLGCHIGHISKSARPKITRKVLERGEENTLSIIQVSGAIRKQAGHQAITELARQLGQKSTGKKSRTKDKASLTLEEVNKGKKEDKKDAAKEPYKIEAISPQTLVETLVKKASTGQPGGHLLALAKPLNGTTLPPQTLSTDAIKNRLRLLPRDARQKHSEEAIDNLYNEINARCSDQGEKQTLWQTLYIEMATVYGEEDRVPDELEDYITEQTCITELLSADDEEGLDAALHLVGVEDDDDDPQAKLYRFRKTKLAAEDLNSPQWQRGLEQLFTLHGHLNETLDYFSEQGDTQASLATIRPYLESMADRNGYLGQFINDAEGSAESFAALVEQDLRSIERRRQIRGERPGTDPVIDLLLEQMPPWHSEPFSEEDESGRPGYRPDGSMADPWEFGSMEPRSLTGLGQPLLPEGVPGHLPPHYPGGAGWPAPEVSPRTELTEQEKKVADFFAPEDSTPDDEDSFQDALDIEQLAREAIEHGTDPNERCFTDKQGQPASLIELFIDNNKPISPLMAQWQRESSGAPLQIVDELTDAIAQVEKTAPRDPETGDVINDESGRLYSLRRQALSEIRVEQAVAALDRYVGSGGSDKMVIDPLLALTPNLADRAIWVNRMKAERVWGNDTEDQSAHFIRSYERFKARGYCLTSGEASDMLRNEDLEEDSEENQPLNRKIIDRLTIDNSAYDQSKRLSSFFEKNKSNAVKICQQASSSANFADKTEMGEEPLMILAEKTRNAAIFEQVFNDCKKYPHKVTEQRCQEWIDYLTENHLPGMTRKTEENKDFWDIRAQIRAHRLQLQYQDMVNQLQAPGRTVGYSEMTQAVECLSPCRDASGHKKFQGGDNLLYYACLCDQPYAVDAICEQLKKPSMVSYYKLQGVSQRGAY